MDKRKTTSEKINDILNPEEKSDIEDDHDNAKVVNFDEIDPFDGGVSEFRKKNIKYLADIDAKYQGNISSRQEIFEESNEASESDREEHDFVDDSNDVESSLNSDESFQGENDYEKAGRFVRVKPVADSFEENLVSWDDDNNEDDASEYINNNTTATDKILSFTENNIIRQENVDETRQKGLAVQNQLKMWEKLLEIRIKSQKCLMLSNAFPTDCQFDAFYQSENLFKEKADNVIGNVENVLENLLELQETLVSNFSDTKNLLKSTRKRKNPNDSKQNKRIKNEEFEDHIDLNYKSYKDYRNCIIQKWYDRTKIIGNLKNQKSDQNILRKIENSLINKDELVKKTQLFRGGYNIFHDIKTVVTSSDSEIHSTINDHVYSPEIFDDSEFYHQLLRELIEFKTNTSDNLTEINNKFAELQKVRNKMKRKVDTKASKGRKIRYVVHNKMINFMAPVQDFAWTDESKTELFNSLFGKNS